jgi:hypothetical protein
VKWWSQELVVRNQNSFRISSILYLISLTYLGKRKGNR